jgi:hypothetical protein
VERGLGSFFNRRVGPVVALVFLAVGMAAVVAVAQLLPEKQDEPAKTASATPTPTATPCTEAEPPYGEPPRDFTYEPVAESRRAQTVKALKLDEAEGKVDVRQAQQKSSGLSLGEVVGVPSKNPADYASRLIASSEASGAKVEPGNGYAILPLASGKGVAVGVKGCRTVMVSALDPNATKFLAAAIFER